MYSFDLQSKLKRLNPLLYIDDSQKTFIGKDFYASALCLKKGKSAKTFTKSELNYLDKNARQHAEDYDSGNLPTFVCGVPTGWVPEFDMFQCDVRRNVLTKYQLIARGWRTIIRILVEEKKLTTYEKARQVFNCQGLGSEEYDRLTRDQKALWAAGFRFKEQG